MHCKLKIKTPTHKINVHLHIRIYMYLSRPSNKFALISWWLAYDVYFNMSTMKMCALHYMCTTYFESVIECTCILQCAWLHCIYRYINFTCYVMGTINFMSLLLLIYLQSIYHQPRLCKWWMWLLVYYYKIIYYPIYMFM